jgi:hypothetical protein
MLDEDKIVRKLDAMVSSRLLLYKKKEAHEHADFLTPEQGMLFTAKVIRRGKYIDLAAFEWNKDKQVYDYYSEGTLPPSEDDIELAVELLRLRNERFTKTGIFVPDSEEKEVVPF